MTYLDVFDIIGYVLQVPGRAGVRPRHGLADHPHGEAGECGVAAAGGHVPRAAGGFVLLGHWVGGGATLGAFGLGAGAGLLIWGMIKPKPKKKDEGTETILEGGKRK